MDKKAIRRAETRLGKARSFLVETVKYDEYGAYLDHAYIPAKKPMSGKEMNRALYQYGLYWKLDQYGRGWTFLETPIFNPKGQYAILDECGALRIERVK